jgi:hypothetical protein
VWTITNLHDLEKRESEEGEFEGHEIERRKGAESDAVNANRMAGIY